jgi:hypothetical protein
MAEILILDSNELSSNPDGRANYRSHMSRLPEQTKEEEEEEIRVCPSYNIPSMSAAA